MIEISYNDEKKLWTLSKNLFMAITKLYQEDFHSHEQHDLVT